MEGNSSDILKLFDLNQKVKSGLATQADKDEYMRLLYQNGSITNKQYNDYLQDRNTNDIIETALVIGGIFLLGYALSKILK